MNKTLPNRVIKRIYWAASACFLMLAAWLYWREGSYVKIFDIKVAPENGQVQVEVLADAENIRVFAGRGQMNLFMDRRNEEGMTHLRIYGECDVDRKDPVSIRVAGDCDVYGDAWEYQVLAGVQNGAMSFEVKANRGRGLYLWVSSAVVMLTGFMWFGGEKSRIQKELEVYGGRVLEKLEMEPGMAPCCQEGKRLFVWYEGQRVVLRLLVMWFGLFFVFFLINGVSHGAMFPDRILGVKMLAVLTGLAALKVFGNVRWRKLGSSILVKDCRPVTGAAAYLLMGSYGIERKWSQFLLYHNGASGLYRSGHCREALEISDMAWQLLPKKPRDYISYVHSSLRYQCLKVLEETQEAGREAERMEILRDKNPGWRQRKGIRRFLGIQDICQWIETGEIERAERSAREILGQWKEGYYRLPVLGLMAELMEFLGKEEEEAKLREEILTFSPENKEVRRMMGEGRLSYREKKAAVWDAGLLTVYGACAVGITVCVIFM